MNDGCGGAQNSFMKVVTINGKPCLAIFATRNITKGEEVLYDYGVPSLPWRKKTHLKGAKTFTNPQKIGKKLRNKASVGMSKVVPTHASSSAGSPTMARRRKKQLKTPLKGAKVNSSNDKMRKKLRDKAISSKLMLASTHASSSPGSSTVARRRKNQLQTPLKGAKAVTSSKKNRKRLREMAKVSKPMVVSTYASSSADGPTVSKQSKKQIKEAANVKRGPNSRLKESKIQDSTRGLEDYNHVSESFPAATQYTPGRVVLSSTNLHVLLAMDIPVVSSESSMHSFNNVCFKVFINVSSISN